MEADCDSLSTRGYSNAQQNGISDGDEPNFMDIARRLFHGSRLATSLRAESASTADYSTLLPPDPRCSFRSKMVPVSPARNESTILDQDHPVARVQVGSCQEKFPTGVCLYPAVDYARIIDKGFGARRVRNGLPCSSIKGKTRSFQFFKKGLAQPLDPQSTHTLQYMWTNSDGKHGKSASLRTARTARPLE